MTGLFEAILLWATVQYDDNSASSDESIGAKMIEWLSSNVSPRIVPTAVVLLCAVAVSITLCCCGKRKRKIHNINVLVTVVVVLVVLASTVPFWYYSAELLKTMAMTNDSASNETAAPAGSAQNTMAKVVDKSILFLDNSVRQVNTTVLTLCWEALPKLQELLRDMANQLLNALALDSRLKPLFDLLDLFLATVHVIVNATESISQARSGALNQLGQMTGIVSQLRSDINKTLVSVCATSSFTTALECRTIKEFLALLTIGPDATLIDTDVSVSVVTLQRLLNLNITQLDVLVEQAKATLNNMIGSVDTLVKNLMTQLIGTASLEFQHWHSEISKLGDAMRTQVFGSDVQRYVIYVVICVSVVLALSLLTSATRISGCSCIIALQRRRSKSKCLRRSEVATRIMTLVLACILVTIGCLMITVGAVVEREVIAPMTTENGRRDLDTNLDAFIRDAGWPRLRRYLQSITDIPLPFDLSKKLPTGIFQKMMSRCGPPKNETLPQILNLPDMVDSSRFINSDLVSQQVVQLLQSLTSALQNRSSESLISKKYFTDLVSQLEPFVLIVDSADYSGSISELSKPLLGLNDTQLLNMIAELRSLGRSVLQANGTDPRGFALMVLADQVQSVRSERVPAVAVGLAQLRDHFVSLQNSRVLGNLTAQLLLRIDDFRIGFDSLTRNLTLMQLRFNQSVDAARPKAVDLLDDLLRRALVSVGHCDGLLLVFEDVSDFSTRVVGFVWLCGLFLMLDAISAVVLLFSMTGMSMKKYYGTTNSYEMDSHSL